MEDLNKTLSKIADHCGYLWARWQDEREYEDFKDYVESIEAKFRTELPAAKVLKVTKRPFKVDFELEGERRFVKVTGTSASWGKYIRKAQNLKGKLTLPPGEYERGARKLHITDAT
jgi:hypothetical protein